MSELKYHLFSIIFENGSLKNWMIRIYYRIVCYEENCEVRYYACQKSFENFYIPKSKNVLKTHDCEAIDIYNVYC